MNCTLNFTTNYALTWMELLSSTEWGRASHGLGQTRCLSHRMASLSIRVGPRGKGAQTPGSRAVKPCQSRHDSSGELPMGRTGQLCPVPGTTSGGSEWGAIGTEHFLLGNAYTASRWRLSTLMASSGLCGS